MPQIIMLNHASYVNYKRTEANAKRKTDEDKTKDEKDPIVLNGKRFSELDDSEKDDYLMEGLG